MDFGGYSGSDDSDDEQPLQLILNLLRMRRLLRTPIPRNTSILTGAYWMIELLNGTEERFYDAMRMERHMFMQLGHELVERGGLVFHDNARVSPLESLGIFMQATTRAQRTRDLQERFQHSNETVSRHFNNILDALFLIAPLHIRPPNFDVIPERISSDLKMAPYFSGCVGAIDGTHIPATVGSEFHNAYTNRHGRTSQNVLAICDFDGLILYVLPGWEGSAHDQRVLSSAHEIDPNFPHPPNGKYYLVDSGYSCKPGYLAPFRNNPYHLPSWRGGRQETGPKERFNHRHSSLRNVIERTFGQLKCRFSIFHGRMPGFPRRRQAKLVTACCVVHNFIRRRQNYDQIYNKSDEDLRMDEERNYGEGYNLDPEPQNNMTYYREWMSNQMWDE